MADRDLARIIADLREQRKLLEQLIDQTALSDEERQKLLQAVERLRERLANRTPQ